MDRASRLPDLLKDLLGVDALGGWGIGLLFLGQNILGSQGRVRR
jgi:hypothetical protein